MTEEMTDWKLPDWAPEDTGTVLIQDGDWALIKDYRHSDREPMPTAVHLCNGEPWVAHQAPATLMNGECSECQARPPRGFLGILPDDSVGTMNENLYPVLYEEDGWRLYRVDYVEEPEIRSYIAHNCADDTWRWGSNLNAGTDVYCFKCCLAAPKTMMGLYILHNYDRITK